jgi:hypothetical protein
MPGLWGLIPCHLSNDLSPLRMKKPEAREHRGLSFPLCFRRGRMVDGHVRPFLPDFRPDWDCF